MKTLPAYIGAAAFGLKMGVFLPGSDLVGEVAGRAEDLARDGLLDDGDVICVTESVVARVQDNIVTTDQVAEEVRTKLNLKPTATLGVVFPIASRNRFSVALEGLSKAVAQGKVVVQLSYPQDEVGNQVIDPAYVRSQGGMGKVLRHEDMPDEMLLHPVTKIDYGSYYAEVIRQQGAEPVIIYANDPVTILSEEPHGIIAADIRTREQTQAKLREVFANCITLQDICNQGDVASKWGLLGSNMSSAGKLKLLPRDGDEITKDIQAEILKRTNRKVEVLIYGDGAYKDPGTGIYELADPMTTFGSTPGLDNCIRGGVKYKMLADKLHAEGRSTSEIEASIQAARQIDPKSNSIESEGTTPRMMTDILASLADLVSGSSDAGTPVILVKNIYRG